tara:strand:- start:1637 stop:2014 length:378 start_codon:yes stop_codon:yes gene_type:complete
MSSQGEVQGATIKAEIEHIEHQDLELDNVLVSIIPAKTLQKFEDPFVYIEEKPPNGEEEGEDAAAAAPEESKTNEQSQNIEVPDTFFLGSSHRKDSEGGDAGSLPKKGKFYPYLDFIRSQYCGKF